MDKLNVLAPLAIPILGQVLINGLLGNWRIAILA